MKNQNQNRRGFFKLPEPRGSCERGATRNAWKTSGVCVAGPGVLSNLFEINAWYQCPSD